MALFLRGKDNAFFNLVSQELVDYIMDTPIVVYKIDVRNTEDNLYGESPEGKSYSQGIGKILKLLSVISKVNADRLIKSLNSID